MNLKSFITNKYFFFNNTFLIMLVVIISVTPLTLLGKAGFEGADTNAKEISLQINPKYTQWIKPMWQPPSSEIETLLFALQASIGTGIICYFLGLSKGKNSTK